MPVELSRYSYQTPPVVALASQSFESKTESPMLSEPREGSVLLLCPRLLEAQQLLKTGRASVTTVAYGSRYRNAYRSANPPTDTRVDLRKAQTAQ